MEVLLSSFHSTVWKKFSRGGRNRDGNGNVRKVWTVGQFVFRVTSKQLPLHEVLLSP